MNKECKKPQIRLLCLKLRQAFDFESGLEFRIAGKDYGPLSAEGALLGR